MADEVLKNDPNFYRVAGAVTNDSDKDVVALRVDPITKRLIVDLGGLTATLTVNKALESLTYDLNAAIYSATTVNSTVYRFMGLFLKFSAAQSKTITLFLTDGTVEIPLWKKTSDVGTSRVFVPDKDWSFPADWELKLTITKTGAACSADILLLTTT